MASLPSIARKLNSWWMTFAHALGWVNTRILLTVFYFVILAIPALILKLIRKDLLRRAFEDRASYWDDKPVIKHSLEQAKHQF